MLLTSLLTTQTFIVLITIHLQTLPAHHHHLLRPPHLTQLLKAVKLQESLYASLFEKLSCALLMLLSPK
jgi:hypothetical protein